MTDTLFTCGNLDEVQNWVETTLSSAMKQLTEGEYSDRKEFKNSLSSLKNMLYPPNNDEVVVALFAKYHADETSVEDKKNLGIEISHLRKELLNNDNTKLFNTVFSKIDQAFSKVAKMDQSQGRSNRAKNAKKPRFLFNLKAAGLLKPEGARLDKDGNASGTEFDLGKDGAFSGLKVYVLQQYSGEGFTFNEPKHAMQVKGFNVEVNKTIPTLAQLKMKLDTANQFWLISGTSKMLSDKHIDAIVDAWKKGMGVYIYGDNDPYYFDANRLLKAMGLPQMSGNYYASEYLTPYNNGTKKGYVTHYVTTGISSKLYEGITIAHFNPKDVDRCKCVPIMYNSEGKISVIVREAMQGCGQVIVDGAFTKLYCHFDTAGSARLVKNCACYLAADFSKYVPPPNADEKPIQFNYTGAYEGECDIMYSTENVAVLATKLGDYEQNTSDFALDNALGLGMTNRVFAGQIYGVDTAKEMMTLGHDPFTIQPVKACLPVVRLDDKNNYKLLTAMLCELFMGGNYLPKAAWFTFYGVCDDMLTRDPEHPEVWEFFLDQMDQFITSTPDFTELGTKIPLLRAMNAYCNTTDKLTRLGKTFSSVCVMVRALKRTNASDNDVLVSWVRHALLKVVVSTVLSTSKTVSGHTKNWFDGQFDKLCYDHEYGICINGSEHTLDVHTGLKVLLTDYDTFNKYLTNVQETLGVTSLLTDEQFTTVLQLLRSYTKNQLAQYKVETLLEEQLFKNVYFMKAWDGKTVDVTTLLHKRFTGFFQTKGDYATHVCPPFITPFGPSCYEGVDGTKFGDWNHVPTQMEAEKIKQKRNAHFQQVYGSDGNGYPTKHEFGKQLTSSHFNLHRSVQRVLTRESYKNDTEVTDAHVDAVAYYLMKENKGDFYYKGVSNNIKNALQSYMDCRKADMDEPTPDEPVDFYKRLLMEQKVHVGN
jgi:hypothetical protein